MSLLENIPEGARVTVDSAPLIYFLDGHRTLAERFAPLFAAAQTGRNEIVVSTVALAEILTGPLLVGNEALAARYRTVITSSPGWRTFPVTDEVAESAARLRIRYKLRLPDALMLATTLVSGSHALVTHDRDFSRVTDVRVFDGR